MSSACAVAYLLLLAICQVSPPDSAATLLQRADSAVSSQISAAQTLVATGKVTVDMRLIKKAAAPTKKGLKEYSRVATFTFTSSGSGGFRRWEGEWQEKDKQPTKEVVTTDSNMDYRYVSEHEAYIDPATSFESIIFDFHRDHWYKNAPLGGLARAAERNVKGWKLTKTDSGRFIATETTIDQGLEFHQEIEVDPKSAYLPVRYRGFANIADIEWSWKKLEKPDLWYPSHIVRKFLLKFPDGDVFEETSDVEITDLRVNEDVDPALFKLEGLGILPGATVNDTRVSPMTSFSYLPDARSANETTDRLLTKAPRLGAGPPKESTSLNLRFWGIIGLNLVVVSGLLAAMIVHFRNRKS